MNIKTLTLYSPQLDKQAHFYSQVLGLEIIEKNKTSVAFQVGNSILRFNYRANFSPYHFAINIPANQEHEALGWLKQRVTILTYEQAEIQYFNFWDAYAIYFYDEDKNIVELIARRGIQNNANQSFDP
ncbi:MAG: VOC family protein, partial [Bacteroidota bacterium]